MKKCPICKKPMKKNKYGKFQCMYLYCGSNKHIW